MVILGHCVDYYRVAARARRAGVPVGAAQRRQIRARDFRAEGATKHGEKESSGKFSGRTRGYFKYPTNFTAHPEGALRAAMKDQARRC